MYLYHGTGEDISGWEKQGKIKTILDNLFAEKEAKEMIVVLDFGVALTSTQQKMEDTYSRTVLSTKNLDEILTKELIPAIEKSYKTNGKRAIAGLSRGSYQAMYIGSNHPEMFTAIGAFSPVIYEGTAQNPFQELPLQTFLSSKSKPLFFIGIGEKEDNRFQGFSQELISFFNQQKIPHQFYESPGTYHEWLTWRRCLKEFAQKIFK